jgi:hypothetical protein
VQLSRVARTWWASVSSSPHALRKPTLVIAPQTFTRTEPFNLPAYAAHERTPGRIKLLANGAVGFERVGDRLCFRVQARAHTATAACATCISGSDLPL